MHDGPAWGRHGRPYWYGGHYETATTETLIPKVEKTEVFLRLAQNHLEDSGFLLRATPADYNVDVMFEGPFITDDERTLEWVWMLSSVPARPAPRISTFPRAREGSLKTSTAEWT